MPAAEQPPDSKVADEVAREALQGGNIADGASRAHVRSGKAVGMVMVMGTAAIAVMAVLLVPPLGLAGAGIGAFASASLVALGTFGYLRAPDGFAICRPIVLGMFLLFVDLGPAGALVGTRLSLDAANLLAKSLACVVALGLMVPLSLDRDERRALVARLRAALRRG